MASCTCPHKLFDRVGRETSYQCGFIVAQGLTRNSGRSHLGWWGVEDIWRHRSLLPMAEGGRVLGLHWLQHDSLQGGQWLWAAP